MAGAKKNCNSAYGTLEDLIPKSEQEITKANSLFRIYCDDKEVQQTMEDYLYEIRAQAVNEAK